MIIGYRHRKFRLSRFVALAVALATFAVLNSVAGEYPLRANTEIIFIEDPRVDFELRNILSRNARYSIDSMTFSQLTEPKIGLPLLEAFKYAQDHGKRVRSMFDLTASVIEGKGTKYQMAKGMLMDPSAACVGEVVCAHPVEKLSAGLELTDYSHAKYVGWDVGTPFEMANFGGRNNTSHALHTMDSGFFIRPIDPSLPYLGTDLAENFEEVYAVIKEMADRNRIKIPKKNFKPLTGETIRVALSVEQKSQVIEVLSILRKPAVMGDVLKPYQFRPKGIQLRTNQLMKQLRGEQYRTKELKRYSFQNDIHANIATDIDGFNGVVDFTGYSYGPTPEVHEALVRFLNRGNGNTLNVFTNGKTAHATAAMNGLAVYYTYEMLADLIERTKESSGKLQVNMLNAVKAKEAGKPVFIHRKQFVLRNETHKVVYTGSDNLTWSSSKKNDELMVMIDDERMTDQLMRMNRADLDVFDEYTPDQIQALYVKRPFLYRCLRNLIKKVF